MHSLRCCIPRHVLQVVVTGPANDPAAMALEQTANKIYRYAKAVLRVTPEKIRDAKLPPALAETIPNLPANTSQALVCVETSCRPPIKNASELKLILTETRAAAV